VLSVTNCSDRTFSLTSATRGFTRYCCSPTTYKIINTFLRSSINHIWGLSWQMNRLLLFNSYINELWKSKYMYNNKYTTKIGRNWLGPRRLQNDVLMTGIY
jgi:hypothetical protein